MPKDKPTGYSLTRAWWDWCFENPEKVRPIHSAIYMFAIEHCNRLGWKEKFGFPSQMTMDAIGVKKHHTYLRALTEIVEFGFITMIQKSKNQYSANIISLFNNNAMPKNGKALSQATAQHTARHGHSNGQGTGCILKPITKEHINTAPAISVINSLFKRKDSTEWSDKELSQLKVIVKRKDFTNELQEIKVFYSSGYKYKRRDIINLLNNWTGELDKARYNKPKHVGSYNFHEGIG